VEVLKAELAKCRARVEAHVAHQEKTKATYAQLAAMYEKLREEYANALKRIDGMNAHAKDAEKREDELRKQVEAVTERNKELEEEIIRASQGDKMNGGASAEEEMAMVVDVDDVNEDMLMPGAEPNESWKGKNGGGGDDENSAEVEQLRARVGKLEGEKQEMLQVLAEVERDLEEEQSKSVLADAERLNHDRMVATLKEELEEQRARATRAIGVHELEDLVATKLALAEAEEAKMKLQFTIQQQRKQLAMLVPAHSSIASGRNTDRPSTKSSGSKSSTTTTNAANGDLR